MARRRKGERVLGPYRDGRGWRIVLAEAPDQKRRLYFETEREAIKAKRIAEQEFEETAGVTIKEAIEGYEMFQRTEKKDKPRSVADTVYRLGLLFPEGDDLLSSLTPKRCQELFDNLKVRKTKYDRPFSTDSLGNIIAESKTFMNWCVSKKKWLRATPLAAIEVEGKRRHGKPQLRLDEARKWTARALELAEEGESGAVAALITLLMGFRASEVVKRVVRDLDDDGKILVVEDAKTEAGNRRVQVPAVLQPLLKGLAEGKAASDRLFGQHWRDWVRKWVIRICEEAGVPVVCAHSMRGLHSTLAMDAGMSAHMVAASLGHESARTTLMSYAKPEGVEAGRQKRVTAGVIGGGRGSRIRRNIVPVSFRSDVRGARRRRKSP